MSANRNPRRLYLDNEGDVWITKGFIGSEDANNWSYPCSEVLSLFKDLSMDTFDDKDFGDFEPTFLLPLEEFMT